MNFRIEDINLIPFIITVVSNYPRLFTCNICGTKSITIMNKRTMTFELKLISVMKYLKWFDRLWGFRFRCAIDFIWWRSWYKRFCLFRLSLFLSPWSSALFLSTFWTFLIRFIILIAFIIFLFRFYNIIFLFDIFCRLIYFCYV